MIIWNPWHGCKKISEGCEHCYMYFLDARRGINTAEIYRTANFNLPVRKNRSGGYRLPSGIELYVGLSTDFFIEEADNWRTEAWRMIKCRPDIAFRLLTKRASRIASNLPPDWNDGYENVMISVTCENQKRADERLPILLEIPTRHKGFMAAPLIGPIDAEKYLAYGTIDEVLCGGENYDGARPCHYEWVKSLSDQCLRHDVTFNFIETGTQFIKGGHLYRIPSKRTQSTQAHKSGLSHYHGRPKFRLQSPPDTLFETPCPQPYYRPHCSTCGSRLTCNGCSNCNNCNTD